MGIIDETDMAGEIRPVDHGLNPPERPGMTLLFEPIPDTDADDFPAAEKHPRAPFWL
ncbi:hypothetical protein [Phaeospirillum tilakii]|uniref:Uncharacterized protein n=1 Tax=Phaeospirillum tilakii TaxID=741673 RepID=A0ABW5CDD5_9PROT